MAFENIAKSLDIDIIHLEIEMGQSKKEWKSSVSGKWVLVEDSVLDYFIRDGWKGYSKEGGLLLNLIKAMSFPKVAYRNRATYIEALYAKNVSFEEDKFDIKWLLANVSKATEEQVRRNYKIMAAREKTTSFDSSMLDFFPYLEEWMFIDLFKTLKNKKIYEIAEKFAENPYEYRKGWPDITMWKDGMVRLLEVKAPGDSIRDSQKTIIKEFIKPLGLNFSLIDVQKTNN